MLEIETKVLRVEVCRSSRSIPSVWEGRQSRFHAQPRSTKSMTRQESVQTAGTSLDPHAQRLTSGRPEASNGNPIIRHRSIEPIKASCSAPTLVEAGKAQDSKSLTA